MKASPVSGPAIEFEHDGKKIVEFRYSTEIGLDIMMLDREHFAEEETRRVINRFAEWFDIDASADAQRINNAWLVFYDMYK